MSSYTCNSSVECSKIKDGWLVNPKRDRREKGQLFCSYTETKYDTITGKVRFEKIPTQVPRGLRFLGDDKIISQSLPTAIDVVVDDTCGLSRLKDIYAEDHEIDLEKCIISPMFDGVLIQIYRLDDAVQFTTSRSLDASRSQWHSQKTFLDLWLESGRLHPNEEFKDLKEGVCMVYLLTAPEFIYISKRQIDKPEVYFVGWWDYGSSEESLCGGGVECTPMLTEEEGLSHLMTGFSDLSPEVAHSDQRLLPGEALVIMEFNSESSKLDRKLNGLKRMYTVSSASYIWKDLIRDKQGGTRARLWHLSTYALPSMSEGEFDTIFPSVEPPSNLEEFFDKALTIDEPINIVTLKDGRGRMDEYNTRLWTIFCSILCSTPVQGRKELVDTYKSLSKDYEKVCAWVAQVANGDKVSAKPPPHLNKCVETLRSMSKGRRVASIHAQRLLENTSGVEIFKMIKCMEFSARF